MALFLLAVGVIGGITGGISSAQNECKYEQQLKDVLAQTEQIKEKSQHVLSDLENQDKIVGQEIQGMQISALAASNNLVELRKAYVTQLQQYQLYSMMFVVVVFMLLLAKKLKII
jgi:hypothetical protein